MGYFTAFMRRGTVGHLGQRNRYNLVWEGAAGPPPDPRGEYSIDLQTHRDFPSSVPIATRLYPTRPAVGGICIGHNNAAGDWATAIGHTNDSCYEASFGCGWHTHAYTSGMFAYSSGAFISPGDCQWTLTVLKAQTTDATPAEVTTGAYLTYSPKTRILWGSGRKTYDCFIRIVGRRVGTAECASFWRRCLVTQDSAVGGQMIGSIQTIGTDYNPNGFGTPVIDLTDAAPHNRWRIRVQVTGKAGATVRWTVAMEILEVADTP